MNIVSYITHKAIQQHVDINSIIFQTLKSHSYTFYTHRLSTYCDVLDQICVLLL